MSEEAQRKIKILTAEVEALRRGSEAHAATIESANRALTNVLALAETYYKALQSADQLMREHKKRLARDLVASVVANSQPPKIEIPLVSLVTAWTPIDQLLEAKADG
ncbi:hypothetical protein AB4Z25_18445 [Rhizobium sp. RAF36]|uniref:hypothetical protein n=1 Tax=Rhizobium sp. RAF36 TaxID=3233055 RepID=UPI003F9515B0